MSLLDEYMKECVLLVKTAEKTDYGGVADTYTDGDTFYASLAYNGYTPQITGSVESVTGLYKVFTERDRVLGFHDVFRRVEDGATFRVTSNNDPNYTPESAGLDLRMVLAERWDVADG